MYILGLQNFASYEPAAALIRVPEGGGRVDYVSISEDRLSRVKHGYDFPLRSLDYCLAVFGLSGLEEVDWLATDFAREARWHNSGPGYRKTEYDYLKLKLNFPEERIRIYDHHHAHAAGAFYPSGFEEAAVLVIDGMGSRLNTQSLYHARDGRLELIERGFGWGIGKLYSLITSQVLPYGPEKGFGKVMGLAPYGREQPGPILDFRAVDKGLITDYSAFYSRQPVSRITARGVPVCTDRAGVMEPRFSRAAFDLQAECERQLVRLAEYAHRRTGSERLCLSGGVALNGRANHLILSHTPFREFWAPPCCSDCGIPLGAALWAAFMDVAPNPSALRVEMDHAYTGRDYPEGELLACLDEYGLDHRSTEPAEAARLIARGKVVAWFEGGSEIGPRALGHRSILADPSRPEMKDILNNGVKFREPFRPFAPSVLEEYSSRYFNLRVKSPFMLLVSEVNPDQRARIPAVCHIDGTARPHDVSRSHSPAFWRLIDDFRRLTGLPLVLNTSFNVNREPIVETPLDALICALRTKIDHLVLGGRHLVDCRAQRSPELTARMEADRTAGDRARLERLRDKYLTGYDARERDRFIQTGNRAAEDHLNRAAQRAVERFRDDCLTRGLRVALIGTAGHSQVLYEYIPGLDRLQVTACLDPGLGPGEPGCFPPAWPRVLGEEVDWSRVEAILISSHEYQDQALAEARRLAPEVPVTRLYDTAMDSLYYTLPGRTARLLRAGPEVKAVPAAPAIEEAAAGDGPASGAALDQRYAFVVNYHYIHPSGQAALPGLHGLEPRAFQAQLAALVDNFQFVTARRLWDARALVYESSGLLTFDDGLRDILDYAWPIMRRYGLTGTVFVCSEPLLEGRVMAVQKRQLLLGKLGLARFSRAVYELLGRVEFQRTDPKTLGLEAAYPYDSEEVRRFKLDLNYLIPYPVLEPVLDKLFEEAVGSQKEAAQRLYLNRDELLRLQEAGWEIGAHGHRHRVMSRLSVAEQCGEIELNRDWLTENLGRPPFSFAYPFGRRNTFDRTTLDLLAGAGFKAGFFMNPAPITPKDVQERFTCPRFDNQDLFDKKNRLRRRLLAMLSTGD